MNDDNEIVGHKTYRDGDGFRHEPLRRAEADEIMRRVDAAEAARRELMPTEESARHMFFEAWLRLKELGWKEACYCPKDGSEFEVIEAGSTGIHCCRYDGEWPKGTYWIMGDGDFYPSRPVLFRNAKPANTD